MGHRTASAPCAVCSGITPSSKLCRVVIDGRTVLLCREHAALVASNPFRSLPAPDAAQPLGCERDPATTGLQVEVSVPQGVTGLFQGLLLFFLLASDFLVRYRITFVQPRREVAAA